MAHYDFEHPEYGVRTFKCAIARYPRLTALLSRIGWERVLTAPGIITETGGVRGPADRFQRDQTGAKLEHLYESQREVKRETGDNHGPFKIRDWEL